MGAVITGIARTAIGRFSGSLSSLRAVDLGAAAIEGALERSGLEADKVDEVIFGQVLQAGEGQITSRVAATRGRGKIWKRAWRVILTCREGGP